MRDQGVGGLLIYCADYGCSYSLTISGDRWPDDLRLSDIEPRFICGACGHRGADVRPEFNCNKQSVKMMGYRRDAKPADLGRAVGCQLPQDKHRDQGHRCEQDQRSQRLRGGNRQHHDQDQDQGRPAHDLRYSSPPRFSKSTR